MNDADIDQHADASSVFGPGDDASAANLSRANNISEGAAFLKTGNASAVGNVARTDIAQVAPSFGEGGGIYIGDQDAYVYNHGDAYANTGDNKVTGNASHNTVDTDQTADASSVFGPGDDASAANSSEANNISSGLAAVQTGNASAVGNMATTNIFQAGPSFGSGGGIYIGDQEAHVYNDGTAYANSGGNDVTGNDSVNTIDTDQTADASSVFGPGDDASAANMSSANNVSDGVATLQTGNAQAIGNVSSTSIFQSGPSFGEGGGIYIGDQEAHVYNDGTAYANSGNNVVSGNDSVNSIDTDQTADASSVFGPGDDASAANMSSANNISSGEAHLETGDASAVGNVTDDSIVQGADFDF